MPLAPRSIASIVRATFNALKSWVTSTLAVCALLTANGANAAIVFSETFDGPALDPAKWTVTAADSRGSAASLAFATGRLLAALPGGSNGYNGVADGTNFTPTLSALTSDFEIMISGEEILRQTVGGYKDNSGLQFVAGDTAVIIAGDNSGYWFGVGYNEYTKHRIYAVTAGSSSPCFIDESLALATMYSFELSIKRVGTAMQVGRRVNNGAWTYTPCGTQTGAVSPKIVVYSGDGGYTYQNGRFTVALDSFSVSVPSPVDGTCGTASGMPSVVSTAFCATGTLGTVTNSGAN